MVLNDAFKPLEMMNQIIYIENNRLLLSGMEKLYELYRQRDKTQSVDTKAFFLSVFDSCYDNNGNLLYLNPLTQFFEFFLSETKHEDFLLQTRQKYIDEQKDVIAKIFSSYVRIRQLSMEHVPMTQFTQRFEDYCNDLCELMGSRCCHIMCLRDELIVPLTQSSLRIGISAASKQSESNGQEFWMTEAFSHAELDMATINYICARVKLYNAFPDRRQQFEEEDEIYSLAETVYMLRIPAKVTGDAKRPLRQAICILLDLPETGNVREHEQVIMIFAKEELTTTSQFSPQQIFQIRNVLFMRDLLINTLAKNLQYLITASTQYSFVAPVREPLSENPSRIPERVHILHISDIHIAKSCAQRCYQFAQQCGEPGKEHFPCDLLVITGDVVQGRTSAGALEQNYELAAEMIRRLAWHLWADERGYLRSDWRKRIIIIPGNHDYASMNEIEVLPENGSRQTSIGRPSKSEGGTFAKFAYYMHFAEQLLRLDMGMMADNGLNEYRVYSQLGVALLALNSVSAAGPLRNNKVLLNKAFLNHQTNHVPHDFVTLCIAHHTPDYQINYLSDRYGDTWTMKPIQGKTPLTVFEAAVRARMEHPDDTQECAAQLVALSAACMDAGLNVDHSQFYADVSYFLEHLSEAYNERCMQIYYSLISDLEMSRRDYQELEDIYKAIEKEFKPHMYLGGHTHATVIDDEKHYYTIDKLVQGDRFHYGCATIEFGSHSRTKHPFEPGIRMLKWEEKTIAFP